MRVCWYYRHDARSFQSLAAMHKRARALVDEDAQVKAQDRVLRDKRSRVAALLGELREEVMARTLKLAKAGRIDTSVVALAYMAFNDNTEVYRDNDDGSLVLCIDVSRDYYECCALVRFLPGGKTEVQNLGFFGTLEKPVDLLALNLWTHGGMLNVPRDTIKYTYQEALVHLCNCLDRAEPGALVSELAEVLPVADLPELVDSYIGPVSHDFGFSELVQH